MATFEGTTWQSIGVLIALFSLMNSLVVWLSTRVYKLGINTQRLASLEEKVENINKRIDKLELKFEKRFDRIDSRLDELVNLLLKKQ